MRVIAGSARGVRLVAPKGLEIRPTLDRVREALFSILGPSVEGSLFLDLFAGSGANGIEALSRGAQKAVFVDNDPRAIAAIERNLISAKLQDRAEIKRTQLPEGLQVLAGLAFDFIFADPPYAFTGYDVLWHALNEKNLLAPGAIVIFEHSARLRLEDATADLFPYRTSIYGETALSFLS